MGKKETERGKESVREREKEIVEENIDMKI